MDTDIKILTFRIDTSDWIRSTDNTYPLWLGTGTLMDRTSQGHSLPELLASIAILGIMIAVGIPEYISLRESFAHQSAVREMGFAVRRARAEGIAHGGRAIVSASVDGQSYTIGIDSVPFSASYTPDSILVTGDIPNPI